MYRRPFVMYNIVAGTWENIVAGTWEKADDIFRRERTREKVDKRKLSKTPSWSTIAENVWKSRGTRRLGTSAFRRAKFCWKIFFVGSYFFEMNVIGRFLLGNISLKSFLLEK